MTDATPADAREGRLGRLWREVLTGIFFTALVFGAKLLVEHTALGTQLQSASYNLLQLRLASDRVPVRLLDISELRPAPFVIDGQLGVSTPRDPLRELIKALVEKEETRPKAIGIDIDFSPDGSQYITPRDPEFFQFCLDTSVRTGVPIYLGVARTNTKPPEQWLGGEEYERLAADLSVPADRRKLLRWVKAGEAARPLASLSAALAEAYAGRAGNDAPTLWRRAHGALVGGLERLKLVEKVSEKALAPGLEVGEFLVDFSPLDELKETGMRTINPVVVGDQAERFKGKVVIIGDASAETAEDLFLVPGREQYFPGVYLHAAAVSTLVGAPLYEVTHKGRVVIDLLLAGLVILSVALINFHYAGKTARRVASRRLQGWLVVLVVLLSLVVGVVFVRVTRVMWDDFILALGVLVLHPSIEHHLHGLWKRFRRGAPGALDRIVFESDSDKEGHK